MSWMQTYTGRKFFPAEPKAEDVSIKDIAHSLSLHCRFNGHTKWFYSIAEHSVRVSDILPQELKLWGLLHDAAEAYTGDIIRPVKKLLVGAEAMEDVILKVIVEKYGLAWPMPREVAIADDTVLVTEKRDLMGESPDEWGLDLQPLAKIIEPWASENAELVFLEAFENLYNP